MGADRERERSRSPRHRRRDHDDGDREHRHRSKHDQDERDRKHHSSSRHEHDRERRRDRDDRHRDSEREKDRERDHGRNRREHRKERDDKHRSRAAHDLDETEEERRERKRARKERRSEREDRDKDNRRERRMRDEGVAVVDDDDDGDLWVEKGVDAVSSIGTIPTADSLPLKSTAVPAEGARSPPARATDASRRDEWMLGSEDQEQANVTQSDFFGSFGTEHKRKDLNDKKPDPAKAGPSKYELNKQLVEGKNLDEYKTEERKTVAPGGPGYQWRMMKLRRLYEQAEEQGRAVEDVALERYGSLDEFNEALEERRVIDERESRRRARRGGSGQDSYNSSRGSTPDARQRTPDARRFVFNSDESRPGSRQGFRRPGDETPGGAGRLDSIRRQEAPANVPRNNFGTPAKIATPIPSVFTPQALSRTVDLPDQKPGTDYDGKPVMTLEQLNKLQAKVLRAKLMDDPDAEALEEQYEYERNRANEAGAATSASAGSGLVRTDEDGNIVRVEMIPTLDGQGRLYDVGQGKEDDQPVRPGNRRKKEAKFETRDREGNLLRYNADDDELTLGELVRQEKFGGGAADQKSLDAELARRITTDAQYQDNLDYMDDNADKLARKKMKTDAMKRAFAINDFQRTKRALDTCPFCWQDDRNPLTAIVALGKRAYLCCTLTEELVPGHCLIAPIQHCLSTLELDDEDWDEIRNFMKCLMRMYAAENKGVIFYETILSFKQQRHTYIECVPVPADVFSDLPAYFRESILSTESEWSQHKKLIDFSTRPGGFRRMLVPNIPYFMVQWDYKGEKGYGHVIEGMNDAAGRGDEDELGGMDEGDKGGGEFPKYFAAEVIGNVLDLEPRKWLRPKRLDYSMNKERARALGTRFQPYNWTVQQDMS